MNWHMEGIIREVTNAKDTNDMLADNDIVGMCNDAHKRKN